MQQSGVPPTEPEYAFDATLEQHLTRIEAYMRGCALMIHPRVKSRLRAELGGALRWIAVVGIASRNAQSTV